MEGVQLVLRKHGLQQRRLQFQAPRCEQGDAMQCGLSRLSNATEPPQTSESPQVLFWFTFFDEVPPLQKGKQMSPYFIQLLVHSTNMRI